LTVLPVIETQAGDIFAYIPTNVISITDGQLYLETELFHAGIRPAVNAGLSVSRVGGAAQIKAMKKVAGKLRLQLAQYRGLEAFAQFGSELDQETRKRLDKGERIVEMLKQAQYKPMKVEDQVIIIYAVSNDYLEDIPVDKIMEFEKDFMQFMRENYSGIGKTIKETGEFAEETEAELKKALEEFKSKRDSERNKN